VKKDEDITLEDDAYRKIKTMLVKKEMVPRQRLVGKDLSEILHMSRTPIIHALLRLQHEGYLTSVPHRGFYVREIDAQEASDLCGVREALEVYAIREAIKNVNEKEMNALIKKAENHKKYMPDRYNIKKVMLDAEFHLKIASMSQNKILERELRQILELIYFRYGQIRSLNSDRMKEAIREHRQLIDKIKNRDTVGGVNFIRTHIGQSKEHLIKVLQGGV
jgi:DNA-binding GntR family transcriptional regulator